MKTIIKEGTKQSFKCVCQNCKCEFRCDISELYNIWRNRHRAISDRVKLTEFPKKDSMPYAKCPTVGCEIDVLAVYNEENRI